MRDTGTRIDRRLDTATSSDFSGALWSPLLLLAVAQGIRLPVSALHLSLGCRYGC